jgi:hypothetical protein
MIQPVLFVGRGGSPILLRVGVGYVDDDTPYEMVAESDPVAIAGPGGECMFTALYVTTKHFTANVSLWITVVIDGVAQAETHRIDLIGVVGSKGELISREIALSVPYIVGGIERSRFAPRGTWFSVRIETKYGDSEPGAAAVAAKQVVESVEVEHEVLRETKQHAAVTAP